MRRIQMPLGFLWTVPRRLDARKMKAECNHQVWIAGARDSATDITQQRNDCRIRIRHKAQKTQLGCRQNYCVATSIRRRNRLPDVLEATFKVSRFEVHHGRNVRNPCRQADGQRLSQ